MESNQVLRVSSQRPLHIGERKFFLASTTMQRCSAWLRRDRNSPQAPDSSQETSGTDNATSLLEHDQEPPPYHDQRPTTIGPAADIASITSALSTVANCLPPCLLSDTTAEVAELISRMASVVAATPHDRDHHRLPHQYGTGHLVSVTGTAEALLTGIDKYLDIVLMWLVDKGAGSFPDGGLLWSVRCESQRGFLRSYRGDKAKWLRASDKLTANHFFWLAVRTGWVLDDVEPVSSARAVAAAITSALAHVANTVAATPEEHMPAMAAAYAAYAKGAAQSITSAIIDARSVRERSVSTVPSKVSQMSGPNSCVAAKKKKWFRKGTGSDITNRPKKPPLARRFATPGRVGLGARLYCDDCQGASLKPTGGPYGRFGIPRLMEPVLLEMWTCTVPYLGREPDP
ncbi:hypothetical protein GE09DRAFT_636876 [Coniochaeta sp. 2T2.1]|nr:hypothetical protein GE09DRAFT_636876 [Coniochaeta sp. 2T2.1]